MEINLHQNGALRAQESKHLSSFCYYSRKTTFEDVCFFEITGKKEPFVISSPFFILREKSRIR